jgi:hypothetical protein
VLVVMKVIQWKRGAPGSAGILLYGHDGDS